MTDVMSAPRSQRRALIKDKETQRKIMLASGTAATGAFLTGATPHIAAGVKRVSPDSSAVNRAASKLATGGGRKKAAALALNTSLVSGALGATSTFNWTRRLKKETVMDKKRTARAEAISRSQRKRIRAGG